MNIEELLKNVQFDYNSPVIITYLLLVIFAKKIYKTLTN